MRKLDKRMQTLVVGLVVALVFCIGVFGYMAYYISKQNTKTMDSVGRAFMAATNEQISGHFSTMIDMRLTQLETLVETAPFDHDKDSAALREWLAHNAQLRGFESLAYYFDDGSYDMLFGEKVHLIDPELFKAAMRNGEQNVCVGMDDDEERYGVIGVPFSIETENSGKTCIALVGRMSIDYISEALDLEQGDSLVYSYIMRADGTFVIRSYDAYRNNYFDRVDALYEEFVGISKEQYVAELKAAMENKRDYSAMFTIYGERRQMYCSSLPNSHWFLLTVMPYGMLNETVNQMGRQSFLVSSGCCIAILLVLLAVFAMYYRVNRAQLKELEEAKKAAEHASRSKSEFLSNMSHDIRTPMNAIVGMTSIAIANIGNRDRVQDCLKKIVLSSKHLLGLINDVLDMSKIESGKMLLNVEIVSLREVMDNVVSIMQPQLKAKQQQFNVLIYDILSENVLCDSVRLNQVLLNLLSNAVKYTQEGGSIETSLHELESPKGSNYVRIVLRVKDNGIGMSEEFQKRIFDSFSREDSRRVQKTEGTGLGMTITKYIVSAMGGDIQVSSQLGVGTEFVVTFDFERTNQQEEELLLPDFIMLVVDDDRQLCESTVESLKSIGVRAEWTLDGESAVQMVKQHHQKHDDYHIILLDWKLPGMDGIKTARELRKELGNNVPILLLSAYDCSEIEEEAREAGINGFLSKPLFRSTLYYGLKPYTSAAAGQAAEEISLTDFSGKRILLAEDNELNAEIAMELLGDLGLKLDWAENGQICADLFAKSPVGFYDAVLMDIRMPVKNGFEATAMIRGMQRTDALLPIIAMTADAFSEDVQRCLDQGMNAHVAKPIDVKEIARVLTRCFEKREGTAN